MFLGFDIGTSSIKTVLVDRDGVLVHQVSSDLKVSRPNPGWSEQDPQDWWHGVEACIARLSGAGCDLSAVVGIGLCGQMHGAVLLDASDRVLRPAILWNDGRAARECAQLEKRWPDLHRVTGNLAMPGFTAPKLIWVASNEPEIFARTRKVLLPKDYVRLLLTGEYASDVSDASGTLWLDVAARRWSPDALAATGLDISHMPRAVEGTQATGTLRADLAARWGMSPDVVVAGGGGDNAASAVGLGAIADGGAFLSLGTSGVLWVTTDRFRPNPAAGVHAFAHAVPGRWHQMGVILSAASAFTWITRATGAADEAALTAEVDALADGPGGAVFLPYLSGERTPHNDVMARGVFAGLDHDTGRAALGKAVMEGVAFAVRDCLEALRAAGSSIERASVVGGGSANRTWVALISTILGVPLDRLADSDAGAAMGAARLGRIAATGEAVEDVCVRPPVVETIEPRVDLTGAYADAFGRYRSLYPEIREWFHHD